MSSPRGAARRGPEVTPLDALVVGAGPAGSATAIGLAGAGWRVALVERQAFPRRKVCGECLAAGNLPLLEGLGLQEMLAQHAGPELRQVTLLHAGHAVTADLPAAPHPRHAWGRAIDREVLDQALLERARALGVQVLQPWAVRAVQGVPGQWHCSLRHTTTGGAQLLQAPRLIDAHGSWEALPVGTAAARPMLLPGDLLAFKANFAATSLRPGVISVLALDGGYGGMVLAGDGVATVACCIRRSRLEALRSQQPGRRAGDVVQDWLGQQCRGVRRALSGAERLGPWLAAGPIRPGIRVDGDDGLFRVGNAAGEAHPILGEGLSMALQSAAVLVAQLLQGGLAARAAGPQAAVQSAYALAWRRAFAPRLRLAGALAGMAAHTGSTTVLMLLARQAPALLTAGARWGRKHAPAVSVSR